MPFFADRILTALLDLVMRRRDLRRYRLKVVSGARGCVLEVGLGSGLNAPFYGADARPVLGLDPSRELLRLARQRFRQACTQLQLMRGSALNIPLASRAVDQVVMTWTLCSIAEPIAALREMRRVMKPGGILTFVEHGLSCDASVARWQHRLTPLWRRLTGGCHLNYPIDELIHGAGFEIVELRTEYARGPRPMTFTYEGRARPS